MVLGLEVEGGLGKLNFYVGMWSTEGDNQASRGVGLCPELGNQAFTHTDVSCQG